jgi:hypothetical protein
MKIFYISLGEMARIKDHLCSGFGGMQLKIEMNLFYNLDRRINYLRSFYLHLIPYMNTKRIINWSINLN